MAVIIPKLALIRISDAALSEYALDKIEKINAEPAFAGVKPTTAALLAQEKAYNKALLATYGGNKADTAHKKAKRKELEQLLSAQARDCARIAKGNLALYLSSGYAAKNVKRPPVGELPRPDMYRVRPTDNEGELKARWSVVKKRQNYSVRAYTDADNPESSTIIHIVVSPSKANITGLPSGEKVYVQVRANGGSTGHSAWSDSDWARPR